MKKRADKVGVSMEMIRIPRSKELKRAVARRNAILKKLKEVEVQS